MSDIKNILGNNIENSDLDKQEKSSDITENFDDIQKNIKHLKEDGNKEQDRQKEYQELFMQQTLDNDDFIGGNISDISIEDILNITSNELNKSNLFLNEISEKSYEKLSNSYEKNNLVDFMKSLGYKDSSFQYRKQLYETKTDEIYKGTQNQNIRLKRYIMGEVYKKPGENTKNLVNLSNSGIEIKSHNDKESQGDKSTNYLCGHVFKETTKLLSESGIKNSFTHISKDINRNDFMDLISDQIIHGINQSQGEGKSTYNTLLTGFGPFLGINENISSEFLFGDGVSEDKESFGIKNIDQLSTQILAHYFYKKLGALDLSYYQKDNQLKFMIILPGNKIQYINISGVRLPVDDDLSNETEENSNLEGDGTLTTLTNGINQVKKNELDFIFSYGVGPYNPKHAFVETGAYGYNNREDGEENYIENNRGTQIFQTNNTVAVNNNKTKSTM